MRIAVTLQGLVICLVFSSGAGAAEGSAGQAAPSAPRAAPSGCAKLTCQRRAASEDSGPSREQPAAEGSESGVSLVMGLGAGALRAPGLDVGLIVVESGSVDAPAPPGSALIDEGGGGTYQSLGSRRTRLQGPVASFGVALTQPLLDTAALGLGLEERFTLAALLPLSGGSYIAGVGDFLLVASQSGWPIEVAVGPSLAVARVDVEGGDADRFEEPAVVTSAAALLRLDLEGTLPGTLDLVGHYGKSLNYESTSYRELQLAFALAL